MAMDFLKILARPKLNEPNMLAAWPGVSNVAILVATYIAKHLNCKELAALRPQYFFEPNGMIVRDSLVEGAQFPTNGFFYYKNKKGRDLIVFIGETQPTSNTYGFSHALIDVAEHFHVKCVYTSAAIISHMHHTETPHVYGVGTNENVLNRLSANNIDLGGNIQIANMNGLILGAAQERNLDGACILAGVPNYATHMNNPPAALAIVKTLASLLEINVDLEDMEKYASDAREDLKQMASEALGDYIDFFTEPIWENPESRFSEDIDDDEDDNFNEDN